MLLAMWVVLWEVRRSFGIGQVNNGVVRVVDWTVGKGLCLMNNCLKKGKVDF